MKKNKNIKNESNHENKENKKYKNIISGQSISKRCKLADLKI